jgi:hypothetical protein
VTFLAFSPLAAYALLGAVALVILLLHLLKPRPARTPVASTVLWASVLKRHGRRAAHWRRALALLLALGIGLSLAAALTRPQVAGLAGKRAVLVVDNSPSMAARTRDGRSRWQHAQERARRMLEATSAEVMLVDTMGSAPVSGFVPPAQALAVLERLSTGVQGPARLPPLNQHAGIELHVFSDGVALREIPPGAIVHSVFEPADNVAITGLQARPFPTDPTRYEAFVQVYNASPGPRRVRLTLRGGESFDLRQELEMAAGELIDATFDVSAFEGGILAAAAATQGDALPVDDLAFTRVAVHRSRRVLLVTNGNQRLEDSLRVLPGVRVTVVKPGGYPQAAPADAYVFDRFAPAAPPAAPALLFSPPALGWLPERSREVANPRVAGWDAAHALSAGQSWQDLQVKRARLASVPAAQAVVTAAQGALIAAGHGPVAWILVGFAPEDSNLPLQPGFPTFLGTALDWLTAPPPAPVRALGSIEVSVPNAQVRDGRGAAVPAVETTDGVVFEAQRPDVYTVAGEGQRLQVIAGVLDPREAEINRSAFGDQASASLPTLRQWSIEPVALLLLFAAGLLLIEWAAYTRRITT